MRLGRNEVKISFEKQEYTVNEKKRTVRCKMYFKVHYPEDESGRIIYLRPKKNCVYGTAFCSPDDVFDEKIGRKIAQSKAENEAYYTVAQLLQKTKLDISWADAEAVRTADDIIVSFLQKASRCICHNVEYIGKLTTPEE